MKRFEFLFLALIHGASSLPFFLYHANEGLSDLRRPCDDYYRDVCDKWELKNKGPKSEPVWSQFVATAYEINNKIQSILIDDDFNSEGKIFYAGCVDDEANYIQQFRVFARKLGGWNDPHPEVFFKIAETTRLLGIHPIIKLTVDVDYSNHTRHILYVDSGDFVFPELFLANPKKYTKELQVYRKWIARTLHHVLGDEINEREIQEIVDFEIVLADIRDDQMKMINLKHLVYMKEFLRYLLEGTAVDYNKLQDIVVKPKRLEELLILLNNTEVRVVSNYIMWCAIKDLSRDVDPQLRKFSFEVDKAILGIDEDLDRKHECTQHALKNFGGDLIRTYRFDEDIISGVSQMANNLKLEFVRQLLDNNWMSFELRAEAVRKILSVRFEIGYPKLSNKDVKLVSMGDNHFINVLKLKNLEAKSSLEQLNHDTKRINWPISVFDVNAYYSLLHNAIILPLGILHQPFYDPLRPASANYAALGSLIGHELSHALDSLLDDLKVACFQTQLGAVAENVADHVGLTISYNTMLQATERIPFMDRRKIFFRNYAKMWCEVAEQNDLLLAEDHAPVNIRVLKTLANSQAFNALYKCETKEQCIIWN